jgi:hypothetical protein
MKRVQLMVGIGAALALAAPATAGAARTSKLSMRAKITNFRATPTGVVANGVLSGRLRSGRRVSHDRAPVRFRVAARHRGRRCDVITLRLAPLDLELLGAQVQTSHISLDVYARKGRVLGDLFCALAHAKVTFPRVARAMNRRLAGRPLRVMAASQSLPAGSLSPSASVARAQTCQVLKLVLGPLHLDLLGLVVDLYGKTKRDPVVVLINAQPDKGLLGQVLCGIAGGGGGISSLGGLQSLLSSLGLDVSRLQLQGLLGQLGIDLSGGLTQRQLNRVLQALGLGSAMPAT